MGADANTLLTTWLDRQFRSPSDVTVTSGGVACPLNTFAVTVTTDGDSNLDNLTLAAGTVGQVLYIACKAQGNAGDSYKITPATMVGGTIITFGAPPIGKGCTMLRTSEGWAVIGNNGGTIS